VLATCVTTTLSASAAQTPLEQAAVVTSGARLQWDQAAASAADLARHEFRLYVDGVLTPIADVRCTGPVAGMFQCSGRIPVLHGGRHALEVSARKDNLEGRRSSPLTVDIDPRRAGALAALGANGDGDAAPVCFEGDGACFGVTRVAALEGRVTSAAVAPDGRLWLVEGGTHIRIVADGQLLAAPALSVTARQQRIVGISLDPSFVTSRYVFVALVDAREPGEGELTIARYREVGGRLAQGAVVVGGLEVSTSGTDPQFLQDADGRLYVALPESDATTGRRLPYAGSLLRFAADGAVPWSAGQNSPALATGLPQPTATALDVRGRRLWLAGSDSRGAHLLAVSTNDAAPGAPAATSRATAAPGQPGAPAAGLGVVLGAADPATRFLLSVSRDGIVERQSIESGAGRPRRLAFPYGTPATVAASGSSFYLAAARPDAADAGMDVYLLSPAR
jgi:hypothetical protein